MVRIPEPVSRVVFLSTPSARRATRNFQYQVGQTYDFYPRPPRGGRLQASPRFFNYLGFLSTPSARRATLDSGDGFATLKISIHALREEGDFITATMRTGIGKFLSTPSARRATFAARTERPQHHISIHALREEGDANSAKYQITLNRISIHALREEGDCSSWASTRNRGNFYPRPPRGGRPS